MKSLVIGAGQVGSALYTILKPYHMVSIRDVEDLDVKGIEVLHICYPDHEGFAETTKAYIERYTPHLVIIHSSVKVGTTKECGEDVIYSPVRGRHPRLEQEMQLFTKFLAGSNKNKLLEAAEYFRSCDWEVKISDSIESLEFLKVLSNVHMGLEIIWRQEVENMRKGLGISVDDYESWEVSYRDGYLKAQDLNLMRPIMNPDPIGGHCILPCLDLLRSKFDSKVLNLIEEINERTKGEINGRS